LLRHTRSARAVLLLILGNRGTPTQRAETDPQGLDALGRLLQRQDRLGVTVLTDAFGSGFRVAASSPVGERMFCGVGQGLVRIEQETWNFHERDVGHRGIAENLKEQTLVVVDVFAAPFFLRNDPPWVV